MTKHHTRLKEGGTSTRPPTVKLSINSGLAFGFGIRHAEPELTDACTVAPLSYCRMRGFVRLVDNLLVSHLIIISEDSLHCSTFHHCGSIRRLVRHLANSRQLFWCRPPLLDSVQTVAKQVYEGPWF